MTEMSSLRSQNETFKQYLVSRDLASKLIENLVENEIPAKRSMVGSLALTQDKIMFFGGVSEQSGLARENCFIYDM